MASQRIRFKCYNPDINNGGNYFSYKNKQDCDVIRDYSMITSINIVTLKSITSDTFSEFKTPLKKWYTIH